MTIWHSPPDLAFFQRIHEHTAVAQLGIEFIEAPRQEAYGQVVVFKDKYGNKWDLIEHNE